jgi:Protein of unknown function (DUF3795)
MAAKNPFRAKLIAPCGIDCAICRAFLREKNHCTGCNAPDRNFHTNCFLFSCEKRTGRYCFTCDKFPCRRLKQLDKRYRTKYHMSMLANLEAIRKNGIRAFVRSERKRWTCGVCGGTVDVHHYRCSACGKEQEKDG